MWIIRYFFLFTLLIFGFGCFSKEPKYCKLSDRIFIPYNKELKKEKQLYLAGSGGAMMGDIQKVNSHYESFECLTVDKARRLYVDVVEGYLERYNQNEEIRPYLHNYPFAVDNIDVMIGFKPVQQQKMDPKYVALVFYIDKKKRIFYSGYDYETKKFTDLYEESYETAREIVMQERDSLSK